ncbi:O-antigen ligase family protein [Ramlibacter alkalitolerans]|uniref:O-antigen ligase family protein n=1 Tax=Ramlibacter alkalitolerans TaxID=2039631 RepID=A0ABS1JKT3_9BURK|nr:O-antigen ligase family protein [Ramlibacter alkalitolerans]
MTATGLLVCCAPLLVLAVRGWANAVLFLGALFSAIVITWGSLPAARLPRQDRRWIGLLVFAYVAPILSVLLSATLRQDFEASQFDSPSRFLLAVPIFLFVLRAGWPVARVMQVVLPLALMVAFVDLQVVGPDPRWPSFRVTTRVVDPLVFGYFSLAFGLMCLASISPREWHAGSRWTILLRIAGFALGVYLSILSSSRTGWAAVPLVLGVWAHYHWGRKHPMGSVGVAAAIVILLLAAYWLVPSVNLRIDEAVSDVVEYPWNGVLQHETSLGYRITFVRMSLDFFALHPWAGVGDLSRVAAAPPAVHAYASADAIAYALRSGFHNQIVSNAVRTGIGGLVATAALMVVPFLICARALYRASPAARKDAAMGFAYCTCLLVSSVSTEVVDLKFAASFYAVMTAVLCGAVLGRRGASEDAS